MKSIREGSVEEYITKALLILLQNSKIEEITIIDLCNKAGVTRMSFYRNYTSKENVLEKYIYSITQMFLQETDISFKNDNSYEYFVKLFTHLSKHIKICEVLYRDNLMYMIKNQFDTIFLQKHHNEYDDYKSYFFAGGIYNVFLLWLIQGHKETPEEIATKLLSITEK